MLNHWFASHIEEFQDSVLNVVKQRKYRKKIKEKNKLDNALKVNNNKKWFANLYYELYQCFNQYLCDLFFSLISSLRFLMEISGRILTQIHRAKAGPESLVQNINTTLAENKSWVVLKLDVTNAFNTIHRKVIFEQVCDLFPELLPYINLLYGGHRECWTRMRSSRSAS